MAWLQRGGLLVFGSYSLRAGSEALSNTAWDWSGHLVDDLDSRMLEVGSMFACHNEPHYYEH